MAKARRWQFEERARTIHRLMIDLGTVSGEQWVLLQSDVHWDNPACDRKMLHRHWQLARDRDAPILDNGDFFCAMQGKWDKRANKDDLRPEHRTGKYLDSLVETATDELVPYLDLLTLRGMGNHETGVLKKHETNLNERLVERLKKERSGCALGGYSGYVVFQVTMHQSRRFPIKMYYHHGYGGGGPVTRGVIQTNRQAVYLSDADLVWTGHTHDTWQMPIARVRLNQDATRIEHTRQVHFRTAGYKEEYKDGWGGWHVERGGPPKPVGAVWMRIFAHDRDTVDYELVEAR